ncbi:hypothetical protein [uncultured Friedmanniella sp.]|uniref:hypothetical protein n=1 Tax=uncultured Friedmanniella sp. TaxID=335381 RepID=UPI0035CB97D0
MVSWIDAAFVAAHADVDGVSATDVPLVNATAAASAYVEEARSDLDWSGEGFVPSPAVKLGTAMLAWRLYQRKDAPLGIITSPTGDPLSILFEDPDIARLLGVGSQSGRFVFGAPTQLDGYRTT